MADTSNSNKQKSAYVDILNLLDGRGLLKERLPFSPALLEEAVFLRLQDEVDHPGQCETIPRPGQDRPEENHQ